MRTKKIILTATMLALIYCSSAIASAETISLQENTTLTNNIDSFNSSQITIEGNNYTIDGNGYHGFYVGGRNTLSITNTTVQNFIADSYGYGYNSRARGGFIYLVDGKVDNLTGTFLNNYADVHGGVIYNIRGEVNNINGTFENNSAKQIGGALYNYEGTFKKVDGIFNNNAADRGGAIGNMDIIESINGTFTNNNALVAGGAIYNENGEIYTISGTFINNSSNGVSGAIANIEGTVNIVADKQDTIFTGNKDFYGSNAIGNALGTINLNANKDKSIIFNDSIGYSNKDIENIPSEFLNYMGVSKDEIKQILSTETSIININASIENEKLKEITKQKLLKANNITKEQYEQLDEIEKKQVESLVKELILELNLPSCNKGTIEFNNEVKKQTINMFDGTLKFGTNIQNNSEYVGGLVESNLNYYGGLITLQNNGINNANLGNLTLHNEMNLSLDADLAKETIDTISADSFVSNNNKINITNINLLSATDKKELSLSPLSADMDSATRQTMADSIIYSGGDVAYGDIYKYTVDYNPATANLNFGLQNNGNSLNDFAPAIASKPIAQSGAQSVQMDSFTEAFRNMDTFMLMPETERTAYKYKNKYASLDTNIVYDPTMSIYQNHSAWFRPYTTFENIPLKNGPKVSNVSYGTYFGYDSSLHELGKGWDGTLGVYAGYNGSHQSFNGNSIYQNGGTVGLIGLAYKGNFFTGWTLNVGATAGSANTIQGTDNFTSLMGGISTKNGYNFEFAEGKFIIQPSVLLSYSLVNTFDYTTSTGVKMKSDPLHTLQIEPSIKLIGNIGTWQPYANVSMVWNLLNESKITANSVELPEVSIKPYVKYGVGLQKKWKDKFTGFGQAYITNGGRNGVGLQAGLRIALGDETKKPKAAWLTPKKKETVIVIDGRVK